MANEKGTTPMPDQADLRQAERLLHGALISLESWRCAAEELPGDRVRAGHDARMYLDDLIKELTQQRSRLSAELRADSVERAARVDELLVRYARDYGLNELNNHGNSGPGGPMLRRSIDDTPPSGGAE